MLSIQINDLHVRYGDAWAVKGLTLTVPAGACYGLLGQTAFVGSFSLLLAGLANSDKQLQSMGTMVILFLCFVSGAWVPAFMLPEFLQHIGPLVPTRWILDGMAGATWRGLGLFDAFKCALALFGFSAVFALVGIKRFKWS